jgi:predicted SnoaL-like aldol condensation-catalyzing enzyme
MSEENKRIARQVLEELFEKGNLDAADELIHPDSVNHEAPSNNPQGPEGLKETVSWLRGLWARCVLRSRTRSASATRSSPA